MFFMHEALKGVIVMLFLRILFPPVGVKIKKTLRNQTVTETQEAVFSLELTHPDVKGSQWIKNGVELQNSDKYEITSQGTVHTLKVKGCNTQDETVYSFKLGKLSANARLSVESEYLHGLSHQSLTCADFNLQLSATRSRSDQNC